MRFTFDGRPVACEPGQTVAAALWASGLRVWRTTPDSGRPRGLYCGIGVCFDCLVTVDGVPNRRACVAPAEPGCRVTTGPVRDLPGPATVGPGPLPETHHDVAVVGAGPAGLAAAATAARAGLDVVLLDAAPRPGGQFWRHRPGAGGAGQHRWREFTALRSTVERLVACRYSAPVWFVEPGFRLHTPAGTVRADRLLLATGAYDRGLPFRGWDLPGVVTPGAAQALLKGSGVLVGRRVVLAGAGPFLLPVAVGLVRSGARVEGVFEAGNPLGYLSAPGPMLRKVPEAARYAAALARHRVPYHTRHTVVGVRGRAGVHSGGRGSGRAGTYRRV